MTEIIPINGRAATEIGGSRTPPGRKTKPAPGDLRYGRSSVANGNEFLPGVDGRLTVAKRFKEISLAMQADPEAEYQLQMIRGFAAAASLAEMLQAKLIAGEDVSPEMLTTVAKHTALLSTMTRFASKINKKHTKDEPRTLEVYLNDKQQDEDEEAP